MRYLSTILLPLLVATLAGGAVATPVAAQGASRPAQPANLQSAQDRSRPEGRDDHSGDVRGDRSGSTPDTARPVGPRTTSQGAHPAGQAREDRGGLGAALRGATRVTFYSADPLQGGRILRSVALGGAVPNQQPSLTEAAQGAAFAVVERPGERVIVALSGPARPDQPAAPTAPQGPGRR